MIRGEKVSMRLLERKDGEYLHAWLTDPDFTGPHEPPHQVTQQELERTYLNLRDERWWVITNNKRTRVGLVTNRLKKRFQEIKLYIVPEERGKGYASEAVKLIVDHLFLNLNIERVQAMSSPNNKTVLRVLKRRARRQTQKTH